MFIIKKVKVSRPCRVRIYENALKQARCGHIGFCGLVLDLVLTDAMVMNGDWIMSPAPQVTTPFEDMVMLVEPPAMVKLTTVEVASVEKTEEFQPLNIDDPTRRRLFAAARSKRKPNGENQ